MSEAMMAISDFLFSVGQDTDYEQFTRVATSGYQSIGRADQAANTQLTSRPLQTISISGQLLGHRGEITLNRLRSFINEGPQVVYWGGARGDGNAQHLGLWLVMKVTETGSRLLNNGVALKTTFNVELQEYQP